MRTVVCISLHLLLTLSGLSQNSITGRLKNAAGETLPFANVALLNPADSTLITGAATDPYGNFIITPANGAYIFKTQLIGYGSYYRNIVMYGTPLALGDITIQLATLNIKGVTIAGVATRVEQKGDTTQFNADAYKVNPDATVEDLAKKMPGITVENGVVKAQGEEVKKVLIDGKEFFGDDVSMALKNLPAEVVDKMQVFDRLSDQAQLTGFDDGNSQKTLNIITRNGKNSGQFGKFYSGYGTDGRHSTGLNLNLFKEQRRISIFGLSNNVNQQNFSSQDLLGVSGGNSGGGGSGRMMGMPPGATDASNFLVGNQNGINATHSLGISYSDSLNKHVKLSASYFFNNTFNETEKSQDREYYLSDTLSQFYNQATEAWSNNLNHRVNLRADIKIDTSNSVIFTPRFSWQSNRSRTKLNGITVLGESDTLSSTATSNTAVNEGYNFNANLIYQHKFKKNGRTVSINLGTEISDKAGETNLLSDSRWFSPDSAQSFTQTANTQNLLNNYNTRLMYTEPLGKLGQVFISYNPSVSLNQSDKNTSRLNSLTGEYTERDSVLSVDYKNTITTQNGGFGLRIRRGKLNLMFNVSAQQTLLEGRQLFPSEFAINRTFNNILPMAMLNYKFSKSSNLRIFYRSSTNIPTVTQLQDVIDNTNPLQLTSGNSQLNQEFSQALNLRFGTTAPKTSRSIFLNVRGSLIDNFIGTSTLLTRKDTTLPSGVNLRAGTQLSMPVNLNGYVNMASLLTYSMPLNFIKCNINLQGGLNYSLTPGLINGRANKTDNLAYTGGVVLGSNISEKIDFTLSYNGAWNEVKNSLQPKLNNNYVVQTAGFRGNWLPWKGLVLNSEITHTRYDGLNNFNTRFWLWNTGVGYKFLKKKAAEFRITAFDILNQNTSVGRTVTETFLEDSRTRVLTRYFMLTFTYNLRRFKGNMKAPEVQKEDPDRMGPPPPRENK